MNFRKSYGSFTVLNIDDLCIGSGIFWGKGINGSGKSTFLKTIAGILSFEGDIILHKGISVKKQPIAYRKGVNFAEAEPLFPGFLTGMEMIKLFVDTKGGRPGQEGYFIESMQMNQYISEPIGTYSSGMLKKLSIVLAFLGCPRLILLDEPLITIDEGSLKVLHQWIDETHRQEGTGFLLSSHQPLEFDGLPQSNVLLVEQQTVKFKTW